MPVTADGIDGLVRMPGFDDIAIVFDATSAAAHARHDAVLRGHSKQIVDLTPAAIGPYVVPAVNLEAVRGGAEPQHGDLRRAGDDSDGGGRQPRHAGPVRRDRLQHRQQVGRPRDAREHRRVHADHGARDRARGRRARGERRSSSSIPPSPR